MCIHRVCPSCFAQCAAGSTVGFLCFLFVVLYQVLTTGLTDLKKKKNRSQELCLQLEVQG